MPLVSKTLVAALALTLAAPSWAQVYACQYTDSTGFQYKEGRWVPTKFTLERPFFLTVADGRVTIDSAGRALNAAPSQVRCEVNNLTWVGSAVTHSCSDYSSQLIFSPENGTGSSSSSLGAVSTSPKRDSVGVTLFACQRV